MNRKLSIATLFLVLMFKQHSIKTESNILRDGALIGFASSSSLLIKDDKFKALAFALINIVGVIYSSNNIKEALGKLGISSTICGGVYLITNNNVDKKSHTGCTDPDCDHSGHNHTHKH